MSRIDEETSHFEWKMVHGQLVRVRMLKPFKDEELEAEWRKPYPEGKGFRYHEHGHEEDDDEIV